MLSQRLFTAVHGCSGSSCPQPPNRIWDTQKSNRGNGHLSIRIYFVAAGGGNVFQSAKADRKIATRPALARSPAQRFVVACRTRRGFSSCPQPPNKKGPGGAGALFCWWRRGESNPRPRALCHWYYMLSFVISFSFTAPDEQGTGQRSQFNLTIGCKGSSDCDPVAVAPEPRHRHKDPG